MIATPTIDALVAEIAALKTAAGGAITPPVAPTPTTPPISPPVGVSPLSVTFDWGATAGNLVWNTVDHGGMQPGAAVRATFTTPASPIYNIRVAVAEYPGGYANYTSRHIAVGTVLGGNDVADQDVTSTGSVLLAPAKPGTTYFISIRNLDVSKVGDFRIELVRTQA